MPARRGYTLVELLVGLTIVAVIVAIVLVSLSDFRRRQVLKNGTETVMDALDEARSHTLASVGDDVYGVHVDPDAVVIFRGSVYNASDPENTRRGLPRGTEAYTALSGGDDEVVFERLTGETDDYGFIGVNLINDLSQFRMVNISQTGIIEGQ